MGSIRSSTHPDARGQRDRLESLQASSPGVRVRLIHEILDRRDHKMEYSHQGFGSVSLVQQHSTRPCMGQVSREMDGSLRQKWIDERRAPASLASNNVSGELRIVTHLRLFQCAYPHLPHRWIAPAPELRGKARRSRRGRGALHTWCSSDRWSCSHSQSGGHTSRPRLLSPSRLLPSRSLPIQTLQSSFISPREGAIVWKSVTGRLCGKA